MLREKEKLFCLYFAAGREKRGAAARAGYVVFPERTAEKLLDREDIQEEIARLAGRREPSRQEVCEGLRRLAFGSVTDAIRLILSENPPSPAELEGMDFFNVSDIKCPKNGGLEIKFFDRLKALEKLAELGGAPQEQGIQHFFQALDESAKALQKTQEENPPETEGMA